MLLVICSGFNNCGDLVMLTMCYGGVYSDRVLAKSSAGSRTPLNQEAANTPRQYRVFFCGRNLPFMVGCSGGACARRPLGTVVRTRSARHPNEIRTSCVVIIFHTKRCKLMSDLNCTQGAPEYTQLLNSAIDAASLGAVSIADLGALFMAIRKSSPEDSDVWSLAGIGTYLCDDWSEGLLATQKGFEEKKEKLN